MVKIIYNFKNESKLMLHFAQWSMACKPEKHHGLSSLDEEKSLDGART